MNKRQKEVLEHSLKDEQAVLDALTKNYISALADIKRNIRELQANPLTQSKAYQLEFQKQLEQQISGNLDNLQGKNFTSIANYLNTSYTNGFIGSMYDMQGQGVPLVIPIDERQVLKAVEKTGDDFKLSNKLGVSTKKLKEQVKQELQRGLATQLSYADIARNISDYGQSDMNRSMRIARTEGHRVQNQARLDAMRAAKKKGADIVKQWDATLDGKTRPEHAHLDGQVRELDENFESDGYSASAPGAFGDPYMDCNCRCCMLQRARWAVKNESTYTKWNNETGGFIECSGYEDFKEKYLKCSEKLKKSKESGIIPVEQFRTFTSGDEVNEFFYFDNEKRGLLAKKNGSYGKWESSLSDDQKAAVSDYTAGGYSDLNKYLRRTNDWECIDGQTMECFKNNLQSVTTSFEIKEPIKVYRYTGIDTFGRKKLQELVNTEFVDNGFMSASPAFEGVENAVITGKDILLEISVPKGKGYGAYINDLSTWKDTEYEFLFACGTKFDITSVDISGNIPIVRMVAK